MSIVLATINVRYAHPSFGLRRLLANMAELRGYTRLIEFHGTTDIQVMLDGILSNEPWIVGLSVSLWNVEPLTLLVCALKARRPDIVVVLGGPEVSHETEGQDIVAAADYVICGEGDLAFVELCRQLRRGMPPSSRLLYPAPPDLGALADPYPEFDDEDIAQRVLYVETSRGCPFHCEYCLSSLDRDVRLFPLDSFLASLASLLERGGTRFKFIDRTFNLNMDRCIAVMEFFLARWRVGMELQFEVVPTRMPERLREVIRRFPPNTLRLEVGVQTFSEDVLARIQRSQDGAVTRETLRFLRDETHAVVHADLIAGLPGEDLDSFGRSFDVLLSYRPAELQVGILKRLRGVPIVRHNATWGMIYRDRPPYELLENRLIPAADMERLRCFARYWERIWNRGRFAVSAPLIVNGAPGAFHAFLVFSDWLYARLQTTHGIPLLTLVESLFVFLTEQRSLEAKPVAEALAADYQRVSPHGLPRFLKIPLRV